MGGGGLMQLVAYGAQDIYLTGSPQITFFKTIYRRHTNFAVESIEQTFNGSVGWGKKISTTISRNGDLMTDVFLEITMKKNTAVAGAISTTTFFPAEALIQDIELEIGGQRIDKHYADWFRIYDSLFRKNAERTNYRRLTDFVDGEATGTVKRFYLPLIFFFNKTPGLALPLIALQYHEVKLNINLASSVLGISPLDADLTVQCYVDYVYLDSDERRRFAQVSHEYLISQLQYTGDESVTVAATERSQNVRLNFNHPTRFLTWVFKGPKHGQYTGEVTAADYANIGTFAESLAPMKSAKLQLNGHDRFAERKGSYFNLVTPWQTLRTHVPAGIYLYSFALKPDEHQPSGSCNFSRIDNSTLSITMKAASVANTVGSVVSEDVTVITAQALTSLKIFAENYNVFRIMSGMGGLAYSN